MLFIGHTRFSLFTPNSNAWHASNNSRFTSDDEYRSYLFSDERLSLRASVFTGVSLPLLAKGAAGHDYKHVVSYPDILPRKYQQILEDAAAEYPFLALDRVVDGHSTQNAHMLARKLYADTAAFGEPFGLFRLDDDDLLSVEYFQRAAPHITRANIGSWLTFGRGVTALWGDDGFSNLREAYHPMNSMGLLSVGTVSEDGRLVLPPDVSHNRSDRHGTVLLNSEALSWVWVRHQTQDTALRHDEDVTLRDMSRFPPLDASVDLSAPFPGVAFSR